MAKKKSTATRRAKSQAASVLAAAIRKEQERKERRRRVLLILAALVVVGVVATLLITSLDKTDKPAAPPNGAVASYAVPSGPADAPTKVTIYEDFLCPFCGQFEAASRAKLEAQVKAGNVQVRYRVLNFLGRSTSTDYSLRSANALAVVLDSSGPVVAKKFHDLLFENQPEEGSAGLSDGQLLDYAVESGAPRAKVSTGISETTFEQWVRNGTSQASKDKVTSTPTVQIDGSTVKFTTIEELVTKVEQAIDKGASG